MPYSRSAVIAGLLWIAAGAAFAQHPELSPQPAAPQPAQVPAQLQDQVQDQMQPSGDPLAAARRITADDALKAVEKGEAVLVDVRDKGSYDAEHAQGAILLPVSEIAARAGELPKDKLVITYCTCGAEQTSGRAVLDLQAKGFKNVACLRGGMYAWKQAGGGMVAHP